MKTKIAIIQLTRFGDLIQTTQAVRQLKAENNDAHITLIARRRFAKGLQFLLETVFDEIITFETKDFFSTKSFKDAQGEVSTFTKYLQSQNFEFTINLSFCKSSSYLSTIIGSPYKLGTYRNTNNQISIEDKWSQFVFSNVLNTDLSPFSLVDIYRYIMGVSENHVLNPDEGFEKRNNQIVIHPFASNRKKRWGISKWTEVIYKILTSNPGYTVHIVGGKEDVEESKRLIHAPSLDKLQDRVKNHTGRDSIAETYQLLMNSKLFVGHDSMVGHLASETLTPGITLSFGSVRPHETTPYSDLFINIAPDNACYPCTVEAKCDLLPCHNTLNTQTISIIASEMLKTGKVIEQEKLKEKVNLLNLSHLRVYTSSYTENGLDLSDISGNYSSIKDTFRTYFKIIWLYYLNGKETQNSLPEINKATAGNLHNYINGVNYLYELYNFGVKYSNKLLEQSKEKKPNIAELNGTIGKLAEIDNLCSVTKKTFPLLQPLVDYFYVNKANALGNNLNEVSQNNILNYYDASNLVAVISDFIEKSTAPFIIDDQKEKEV